MNTQLITTHPLPDFQSLDRRTDLQPSTKEKYRRAWMRAINDGVDLSDPESVAEYAISLSPSGRLFLSAMMRHQTAELERALKNGLSIQDATPEKVAKMQTAIWKLESLRDSISTHTPEGTKAHIWLSRDQVTQITALPDRSTLQGMRDYIVLAVLLGAGLRREELASLTFSALKQQPTTNGMRDVLAVRGKGGKTRVIPTSALLAYNLRKWQQITGPGKIARAINKAGIINGSLSAVSIHRIVRKYGAMIDLPELDAHDLRRTYARLGYDAGVPVEQISRLLGHADVRTTMRYLGIEIDIESTISDFIPVSGD